MSHERLVFDRLFKLPAEFNESTRVCVLPGAMGEYDRVILSHPKFAPSILDMNTGEIVELHVAPSPK